MREFQASTPQVMQPRKFRFLIGLVKLASKRYAWRITVETWTRRSE